MSGTVHVYPQGDAIVHQTDTEQADCACGPATRPVKTDDGTVGWVIVHASLDGRELSEPDRSPR